MAVGIANAAYHYQFDTQVAHIKLIMICGIGDADCHIYRRVKKGVSIEIYRFSNIQYKGVCLLFVLQFFKYIVNAL
jgi:hypothetical protein